MAVAGNLSPKPALHVPDLDQAKSAALNSLPSKESRPGYRHARDEFIAWYFSEPRLSFNQAVVTRYRIHQESRQLAPGTIKGRLAAIRRLAYDAAGSALLSPDLAAGIRRVKGRRTLAFVLATCCELGCRIPRPGLNRSTATSGVSSVVHYPAELSGNITPS